jgi:hypothetical protein
LHLEVQAWREAGFERRVYVYNSRAEDRFGQPVVSLVLLLDDDRGGGRRATSPSCTARGAS